MRIRIGRNRSIRNREGMAAVELAVVLPFFVLMFAAALDFARIYNTTQTLQDCAAAGASYASGTAQCSASVGPTAGAQSAACTCGASLSPVLQAANVSVISNADSTVTVTVNYNFEPLTPLLGSSITLQRSVTMSQAPVAGN